MDENGDVRVMLIEDLDPESPTYGAMSLGSLGFQIANKRTADDTDWDWTTFGNAQGFNADLIIAGTLQAINILGSVITGSSINNGNGTFEVSAEGALKASNAEITGDIKSGSTISGSTISGGEINGAIIKTGGSGQAGQFESYYDNDFLAVRIQGGRYNIFSPFVSGVQGGYITGYGSGTVAGIRINAQTGGPIILGSEDQSYFRIDDTEKSVRLLGPSATPGQNVAFVTGMDRKLTLYAPVGIYINPGNGLYINNLKGYTGTKNGIQFNNGIAVG